MAVRPSRSILRSSSALARSRSTLCRSRSSGLISALFFESPDKSFVNPLRLMPAGVAAAAITDSTFPYLAIRLPMLSPAALQNAGLSQTSCRRLSIPSCSPSNESEEK